MKQTNDLTPLTTTEQREAGFVVPIVGRTVHSDVIGFPGFPLIRAGETITSEIAEIAQSMGRLFELTAATRVGV